MTKRKIYYVPGTISLLLLLPLLYEWCQKEQASTQLRVLEVMVSDPKGLFANPAPIRDYLSVELTGNAVTDKIKLDYAQIRIHEIETSADQLHGINIRFTDSTKYRSVVRVMDMLLNRQSNTIRWLWWKKNVWCFLAMPQTNEAPAPLPFLCGTSYMNQIELPEDPIEKAIDLVKSFWPVAIAFSELVLCTGLFILRLRPTPLKLMRVLSQARGRQ